MRELEGCRGAAEWQYAADPVVVPYTSRHGI